MPPSLPQSDIPCPNEERFIDSGSITSEECHPKGRKETSLFFIVFERGE